jgi:hypothetical protein
LLWSCSGVALEFWSSGVLEFWSSGVLEFWSSGVVVVTLELLTFSVVVL